MRPAASLLPPSSSFPSIRTLGALTLSQISSSLDILSEIYFPLPAALDFKHNCIRKKRARTATVVEPTFVDSGYGTEAENDDDNESDIYDQRLAALRRDKFEQDFAKHWLAKLIECAGGLGCLGEEAAHQQVLDKACDLLESLYTPPGTDIQGQQGNDDDFSRSFSFETSSPDTPIKVKLNDGLAGTSAADYQDVGLQSWGASIIFSDMICADPERFNLHPNLIGSSPRIIELGAGTGLVSLVIGVLLPRLNFSNFNVIATDYHPTVLDNLRSNIATNFPLAPPAPVEARMLDWLTPTLESDVAFAADVLVATDVIYAPEHAVLVRNCATKLLAANGTFWLVATVREIGRFEGISGTAEASFGDPNRPSGKDGRRLTILSREILNRRHGIGRGDESGYKLLRIGWV